MKKSFKRYLSLVMVLMVAFVCLFSANVKAADSWVLVKDVNTLSVGDQIVIAAKNKNFALSTTQNSNNRGQAAITKSGEMITFSDGVEIITLEAGKITGTFAFKAKSGYLYCASTSSKNYLRTQNTLNAAGSWTITITSAGVATIKSNIDSATTSRSIMKYNPSSSLFACYSSGQEDLAIYKLDNSDAPAEPFVVIEGNAYSEINKTSQLTASVINTTGTPVWSTSNSEVATVDANGLVTAKSIGTTTISATVNGTKGELEFKVYPVAGSQLTIAEAIAICKIAGNANTPYKYSSEGTIKSIDAAYSSQYNNIEVTLTDGTNNIKLYRLKGGETLKVGDKIKVTGNLINFSGTTPEYNSGSTYELIVDPIDAIVEQLNNVESYMSLAYTYTPVEGEEGVYDSVFRIRCGIDFAIADIEGVESFGIKVATSEKEKEYDETSEFWAEDNTSEEQCYYVVIDLGNLFAADERFEIEFTVSAYVVVDGEIYYSEFEKTFSVAYLVAYYYESLKVEEVKPLYDLLLEMGKIE